MATSTKQNQAFTKNPLQYLVLLGAGLAAEALTVVVVDLVAFLPGTGPFQATSSPAFGAMLLFLSSATFGLSFLVFGKIMQGAVAGISDRGIVYGSVFAAAFYSLVSAIGLAMSTAGLDQGPASTVYLIGGIFFGTIALSFPAGWWLTLHLPAKR